MQRLFYSVFNFFFFFKKKLANSVSQVNAQYYRRNCQKIYLLNIHEKEQKEKQRHHYNRINGSGWCNTECGSRLFVQFALNSF